MKLLPFVAHASRRRAAACVVAAIASLTFSQSAARAEDKSGARDGLVKLPAAGGTVSADGSSFSVQTNNGAATYTLPLPELPGRAGVTPTIKLTYNQMNGDSATGFGAGWRLDVPSIDVNLENGIPWATAFADDQGIPTNDNKVRLLGQRLLPDPSQPGQFRLQTSDAEIKVRYHGQPFTVTWAKPVDGVGASIPSGFEVVYPDGKVELYSADPATAESSGDLVTKFPLVYQVFRQGESIAYKYVKANNRSYLHEVAFASGMSRYTFDLLESTANVVSYRNGFRQSNGKLVQRLVASYGGQVRNRWCFVYDGPTAGDGAVTTAPECRAVADADRAFLPAKAPYHDRLQSIWRFGSTAQPTVSSVREPHVRFEYSTWDERDLRGRQIVYSVKGLQSPDTDVTNAELLDVNADGLPDVLKSINNAATQVFYNDPDVTKAFTRHGSLLLNREGIDVAVDLRQSVFQTADINGDSFVDIVEMTAGRIHVYGGGERDPENSFRWRQSIDATDFDATTFDGGAAQFVDINQDGRSDIITTTMGEHGQQTWDVYLNMTSVDGNGWHVSFLQAPFAMPFATAQGQILRDALSYDIIDVNGDGLPDFTWFNGPAQFLCVYENTGAFMNNSQTPSTLLFGHAELHDPTCGAGVKVDLAIPQFARALDPWLLDVTGDGIKDFITMGSSYSELMIWYGLGELGTPRFAPPVTVPLNVDVQPGDRSRTRIADLDGDGQGDILVFQPLADISQSVVMLDFNRSPQTPLIKSGLLTAVVSEAGARYDVRYATSTDEMARDLNQNLRPYPLHFPAIVAKEVVRSTGRPGDIFNNVEVTEYFYHDPYYDPTTRDFRGFAKVDQLLYGDEGLTTHSQESAYVEETFVAYDADTLRRLLSGRPLSRRVSSVQTDPDLLAKIKDSNSFDPRDILTHSLSTATQKQALVRGAHLIEETTSTWTPVEQVASSGAYFARFDGSTRINHGAATATIKTTTSTNLHDTHNVLYEEDEASTWAGSPQGVTVPDYVKVTKRSYDQARQTLAAFEAIDLPSDETTTVNGVVVNQVHTDYEATKGVVLSIHRTIAQSTPAAALLARAAGSDTALLAKLQSYVAPTREELTAFGYDDGFGNVTSRTDELGLVEEVHYDAAGILPLEYHRVNLEDRTLDQVTVMEYGTDARLAKYTTPLKLVATLLYDDLGRRASITFDDGGEETYAYRAAIDDLPELVLTTSRRFAPGTVLQAGETEKVQTLAAYRSDGVPLGQIENADSGGVRVRNYGAYNRKKNLIFSWVPYLATTLNGKTIVGVQDLFDAGQIPAPAQADQPASVGTAFRYDPLDRVSWQRLPSAKEITNDYEPWGKLTVETYPLASGSTLLGSRQTSEITSPLGVLGKIEAGDGKQVITRFDRDAAGNLASITLDGEAQPRVLRYDSSGKQEYEQIPGVGELYSLHDPRGRVGARLRVSSDGKIIELTELAYDSLDRTVHRWEGGRLVEENVYDQVPATYHPTGTLVTPITQPIGLLTTTHSFDPNNVLDLQEQLGYDARGAVVNRTIQLGQRTFSENFGRTLDGALTTIVTPRGLREDLTLNRANRLSHVTVSGASFTQPEAVIDAVTYNAKNQIASVTYRNQSKTVITYDPQTLLTQHIDSSFVDAQAVVEPLQSLRYDIDGDEKITAIHDEIQSSVFGAVNRSATFGYDWRGELTSAARYGQTLTYTYDNTGSFTSNGEMPGAWRAGTSTQLLPLGTAASPFDYDTFGRLIASPEIKDAQYDAQGRLIAAHTKTGQDVTFGYGPDGARYYKRVVATNGTVTESLYPANSYSEEPSGAQSFVFVGSKRLVRFDHGPAASPDRWFYYLEDQVGSNDILMAADGQPVEQILYLPYGSEANASQLSPAWASHLSASASSLPQEQTHYRYAGHYADDETGLYYYGTRYYHPRLGRFTTPDALFIAEPERCAKSTLDCNLYGYANNNPLTYEDPDGRNPNWDLSARGAEDFARLAHTAGREPNLQQSYGATERERLGAALQLQPSN